MENKEMFDQIINEMNGVGETTTNEENLNPDNINVEDSTDDSIMLTMSTGETYLVDARTFDWDGAVKNLTNMIENENALLNIMFTLLQITDPDSEDSVKTIESVIEQVDDFMDGFQIHPSYDKFDPNISNYKKAMLMIFDANNVVRTISHNTQMYEMLSNISAISAFNCEEECNCNHHHHDDEAKIFKVAATIGDNNNVDITTIEESFCDPDEIDIIDNDGDNMFVHVYCYDEEEARKEAMNIFLNEINGGN